MTCGIYKIQNLKNGKVYIGQSINIEDRWSNHKSIGRNKNYFEKDFKIYQAFNKYGLENFSFDIIEECKISELNEKEKYWIKYYNSFEKGYNMTLGGQGFANHSTKLTEEEVNNIKIELKESNLLIKDIALKYNVHPTTITNINLGYYWRKDDEKYPIRIPKGSYIIKSNNAIHYCTKPKCKICGKILSNNNNIYCRKCYDDLKQNRPSKEEFKKQLRELKSIRQVILYYNRKGYYTIKNWCKYYNLPDTKEKINSYSEEEWNKL